MRTGDRADTALRPVTITTGFTEMAAGSALIECGRTKVLCTASVSEGVPPFLRGSGKGWLTAEYAMLPGSTPDRKSREFLKRDGRSIEIQRLIGRSLRTALDFYRLGERTVTVDCDVLQADGGTRTASITGGFVALCLAVDKLMNEGKLADSPIVRQVAAVSCGLVNDRQLLDLEYIEDSAAQADMNLVAARDGAGETAFTEVQITGEKRTVSRAELNGLMDLGEAGIRSLMEMQRKALGDAVSRICQKPGLILASNNFGKLKEMKALFGDRFDVRTMRDAGVMLEVEETGDTFEENAVLKAEALLKITGRASVADDSGLSVDALGGQPGVYSARYCGVHGDDAANNEKLLNEMQDVADADRTARFVCAMALARPGRETLVVRGECEGTILRAPKGDGGFGYDPLFFSKDLGVSFSEASMEAKAEISHRGRAARALLSRLSEEKA